MASPATAPAATATTTAPADDGPPSLKTYRGNCHCGAFVWEAELPEITVGRTCNCSVCYKKGSMYAFPPRTDIRWIKGSFDELAGYSPIGSASFKDAEADPTRKTGYIEHKVREIIAVLSPYPFSSQQGMTTGARPGKLRVRQPMTSSREKFMPMMLANTSSTYNLVLSHLRHSHARSCRPREGSREGHGHQRKGPRVHYRTLLILQSRCMTD